jgi:peptide subunit release factor 1 (eRF1)
MKRQKSSKKLAKIQRRVIRNSGLEKISAIIADMQLSSIRVENGQKIYSFRSEDSGIE